MCPYIQIVYVSVTVCLVVCVALSKTGKCLFMTLWVFSCVCRCVFPNDQCVALCCANVSVGDSTGCVYLCDCTLWTISVTMSVYVRLRLCICTFPMYI